MAAVDTVNLTKIYHGKEPVHALKGVSLSIGKGELFTLLGQNGAGKTTFLKILSTQLLPTDGEARVLGHSVSTQAGEIRKRIAVVPQDVQTYGNFTPWEYCYYFSLLRGMSKMETERAAEQALKQVELWDLKNRTCMTLSGGEKKRAIIALALAANAEILLLDEPTSGLDALARRKVWTVLRELVAQGKTILLTTHIMEEAEMLSDRLAIIDNGKVVAEGTVEEIKNLTREKFRIVIEGNSDSDLGDGKRAVKFGSKQIIYVEDANEALELVRDALKKGVKAETSNVTLEDVFVQIVGGNEDN
jgi:ABC-2 type transport system ATP-binding protein